LRAGWSFENIRKAARWFTFYLERLPIDISESFNYPSDGYISSQTSAKSPKASRKLVETSMKYAALHAPPVLEWKQSLRSPKLPNISRIENALRSGSEFPALEIPKETDDELGELARGLKRVLTELENSWSPGSKNFLRMSEFVERYL